MSDDDANTTEVDVKRLAHLGLWMVAVCIQPDGTETFWLLSPDTDPGLKAGCACARCAPHEQIGPMPSDIDQGCNAR